MERRPVVELQDDSWVVIRRCRLRREAERYALVLAAMGISSRIHFDGQGVVLLVAAIDAECAERQIDAYVRENSYQPPARLEVQPARQGWLGAGAYSSLLLFLNGAATRKALRLSLPAAVSPQAGLVPPWQLVRAAP